MAEENAKRLGLDATFVEGDLFEPLAQFASEKVRDGLFDMIISNPPYIASNVIETLMPEVKDHEPLIALDGREDGLYFYRQIIEKAPAYMRKGAMPFLEIGYDQAEAVRFLLQKSGFVQIEVIKDYAGLDRVVKASVPLHGLR